MRLLLIRHGQTPYNVTGALDTAAPGAPLTPLGLTQAAAVPDALRHEDVAGIYVSGLTRTHLTAEPLARATGHRPREHVGLGEISAGSLELRSDEASVRAYVDCGFRWATGDLHATLPGGESGQQFVQRFQSALECVADDHADDETIAIFSHGAAIRVYATIAADLAPAVLSYRHLGNTGMVTLVGSPRIGWRLEEWREEPLGGVLVAGDDSQDVTANPDAEPRADARAAQ